MASSSILLEYVPIGGGAKCVGLVTINRPQALNALTFDMILKLAQTFRLLEEEERVCAVILTGAGEAFSAGIDLTAASKVFKSDETKQENDLVLAMEDFKRPIIGAIHGPAVTAGFEIALACDILFASTDAFFMDTHCKFGIMPGWGLSQKLSRMVGINRARDASFTARKIDAETAYQWGLVSKLFQSKRELLEAAFSTAKMISRNDRKTVENYKNVLIRGYGMSYEDAREMERKTAWDHYGQMPADHFEKLAQFIKSRQESKGNRDRDRDRVTKLKPTSKL